MEFNFRTHSATTRTNTTSAEDFVCPYCNEVISYLNCGYTETVFGTCSIDRDSYTQDYSSDGSDDFEHDDNYKCPECGEELSRDDLQSFWL